MCQGRFGLVMLMCSIFCFLGCGLSESSNKQQARLMDELRAQTALKGKLQHEVDELKAELAKLREETAHQGQDLATLAAENDTLVNDLRELKKERDTHAASLTQLRSGIKSLLSQADAALAGETGTTTAAK